MHDNSNAEVIHHDEYMHGLVTNLALGLFVPVVARPLGEVADDGTQAQLAHKKVGTLAVGNLCS